MGIWNPVIFLDENLGDGGACTAWNHVDNFDNDWEDSAYWWKQRTTNDWYNVFWNNACAIRLLIEKCNSLQAQIDAGNGVVDMNAMLDAMWESKSWQTLLFIVCIDGMRGSLSEKTVTKEAMAKYLRHFLGQ